MNRFEARYKVTCRIHDTHLVRSIGGVGARSEEEVGRGNPKDNRDGGEQVVVGTGRHHAADHLTDHRAWCGAESERRLIA